MMVQAAVLSVLLCSVHSFTVKSFLDQSEENSGNTTEDDYFSISRVLEKANVNVGKNPDDPLLMDGDIAVPTGLQNADPCTERGCLWTRSRDGKVYVPYRISQVFSQRERDTIIDGLESFAESTCIRFIPYNRERNFVDIHSRSGCYSYIGRRNRRQEVSLDRNYCVFLPLIQHELMHALGFRHEESRSDRDEHVQILMQNVKPGKEDSFYKVETRNLDTPYDYNSVMQSDRYYLSKNGQPTIIPIPNNDVAIGKATQMSPNDILRVNRLYGCKMTASRPHLKPLQRKRFL